MRRMMTVLTMSLLLGTAATATAAPKPKKADKGCGCDGPKAPKDEGGGGEGGGSDDERIDGIMAKAPQVSVPLAGLVLFLRRRRRVTTQ